MALLVTLADLRSAGLCAGGARAFAKLHGLDWADFVHHGLTPDKLRATGDGIVELMIAEADKREAKL